MRTIGGKITKEQNDAVAAGYRNREADKKGGDVAGERAGLLEDIRKLWDELDDEDN